MLSPSAASFVTAAGAIHALPTLPRKAGQAREKRGFPAELDKSRLLTARASALPAKLDKRVCQRGCHFQWQFALTRYLPKSIS